MKNKINEGEVFYMRIAASILGARVLYVRFPHQRKITDTNQVDQLTGSYMRCIRNVENKFSAGWYKIEWRNQKFLCSFTKNPDGTLSLESVDGQADLIKFVHGDVLRYCHFRDGDLKRSDVVFLQPHVEADDCVSFLLDIPFKVVVPVESAEVKND